MCLVYYYYALCACVFCKDVLFIVMCVCACLYVCVWDDRSAFWVWQCDRLCWSLGLTLHQHISPSSFPSFSTLYLSFFPFHWANMSWLSQLAVFLLSSKCFTAIGHLRLILLPLSLSQWECYSSPCRGQQRVNSRRTAVEGQLYPLPPHWFSIMKKKTKKHQELHWFSKIANVASDLQQATFHWSVLVELLSDWLFCWLADQPYFSHDGYF